MRNLVPVAVLFLITSLSSCKFYRQYKDTKIAMEILGELGATDGELHFTTDALTKNPNEKHFLELNVVGSSLIKSHAEEKQEMASHIAIELYKRLNPETIQENYGINILFDGQ